MRAAIYARVASATPERILTQLEALRAYAAENGMEVIEEFTDDGYSGLGLDRPGLDRMRRLAARRGFDVLLSSGPDRLARKLELLAAFFEELERFAVKTVFVDGGGGAGDVPLVRESLCQIGAEDGRNRVAGVPLPVLSQVLGRS